MTTGFRNSRGALGQARGMARGGVLRHFADGGDVDDNYPEASPDEGGGDDEEGEGGGSDNVPDSPSTSIARRQLVSGALNASGDVNSASDDLRGMSRDITGAQPGPISERLGTLQSARSAAAQKQSDAIDRAMQILQQSHAGQTTNLPLLAAAGALMAPTRTGGFAESLSNATAAALPAVQQQRKNDMDFAAQQGKYGISAAGIPLSQAEQDEKNFLQQIGIGERGLGEAAITGTRQNIANAQIQGRADVANAKSQAWAQVSGERDRSKQEIALAQLYVKMGIADSNTALAQARLDIAQQNADTNRDNSVTRRNSPSATNTTAQRNKLVADPSWQGAASGKDYPTMKRLLTQYGIPQSEWGNFNIPQGPNPRASSVAPIPLPGQTVQGQNAPSGNPLD